MKFEECARVFKLHSDARARAGMQFLLQTRVRVYKNARVFIEMTRARFKEMRVCVFKRIGGIGIVGARRVRRNAAFHTRVRFS